MYHLLTVMESLAAFYRMMFVVMVVCLFMEKVRSLFFYWLARLVDGIEGRRYMINDIDANTGWGKKEILLVLGREVHSGLMEN